MDPLLKLQKTWLSVNFPFVRFRNLNVITFLAGGMSLVSQKFGGAAPSSGRLTLASPESAGPPSSPGAGARPPSRCSVVPVSTVADESIRAPGSGTASDGPALEGGLLEQPAGKRPA